VLGCGAWGAWQRQRFAPVTHSERAETHTGLSTKSVQKRTQD